MRSAKTTSSRGRRKKSQPTSCKKLAGDYRLADQTVTFAVTSGVLHLTVPGQPASS